MGQLARWICFGVGLMLFLPPGLLLSRSAALAATPFIDLIVFGDSVSDNGNDTLRTLTRMYNVALDEVLDVVDPRANPAAQARRFQPCRAGIRQSAEGGLP